MGNSIKCDYRNRHCRRDYFAASCGTLPLLRVAKTSALGGAFNRPKVAIEPDCDSTLLTAAHHRAI